MIVTQPNFNEKSYIWKIMKLCEKQENGLFPGRLKINKKNSTSNKSDLI